MNGFYNNSTFYGNTDSLNFEKKYWDVLDNSSLVGSILCRSGNNYKCGGIFQRLFLSLKVKEHLTNNEYGNIEEYKIFRGSVIEKDLYIVLNILKWMKVTNNSYVTQSLEKIVY